MALTDNMREALLSCYNASYGGKYELAGRIENLEKLAQSCFISFSSARARVILLRMPEKARNSRARMTEKGVSEAQKIVDEKREAVGYFLKSLDSLPSKIRDLYRFLLKQWLRACENKADFDWRFVRNWSAEPSVGLLLPEGVRETISRLTASLVEKGLAAYASLHDGPSNALMTCPEIRQWLLDGLFDVRGVRREVLDEYLKYLINGLRLSRAIHHLLFLLSRDARITISTLRWQSHKFGVPMESFFSWLEELEGCGYISELNKTALNVPRSRLNEEYVVARGDPWLCFLNPREDESIFENEVKRNMEKWFAKGEETFIRLELRPARM